MQWFVRLFVCFCLIRVLLFLFCCPTLKQAKQTAAGKDRQQDKSLYVNATKSETEIKSIRVQALLTLYLCSWLKSCHILRSRFTQYGPGHPILGAMLISQQLHLSAGWAAQWKLWRKQSIRNTCNPDLP